MAQISESSNALAGISVPGTPRVIGAEDISIARAMNPTARRQIRSTASALRVEPMTWRTVSTKERSSFLNRGRIAGNRIGHPMVLPRAHTEQNGCGDDGDHPDGSFQPSCWARELGPGFGEDSVAQRGF